MKYYKYRKYRNTYMMIKVMEDMVRVEKRKINRKEACGSGKDRVVAELATRSVLLGFGV